MASPIQHRAALDHVLGLIADAPWSSGLVLRGSMLMTAWCGDDARPPADLDFVVVNDGWPVDALDPYPYVEIETVQQWPEAADGAGRYEIWTFEDFDTGGLKPRLPPEGLRWMTEEDWEPTPPYEDLIDRIRREPSAGRGVTLDAGRVYQDNDWSYTYYAMAGVRLIIPWRAEDLEGQVQVEFAQDETLPQPPIWTRIPRMDGGQSVVSAAGPELSLRWKLAWLIGDTRDSGVSRGKDLYDAVLLAELPGIERVACSLTREDLDTVRIDWEAFTAQCPQAQGTLAQWKQRLADALGIA